MKWNASTVCAVVLTLLTLWAPSAHAQRFYDPGTGQFLSLDPKGMIDGPNMYLYCGGDPVNRVDPMGTDYVYAENGVAYLQSESYPGGLFTRMGDPVRIGTTDGTWINMDAKFGGGIASLAHTNDSAQRGFFSYGHPSNEFITTLTQSARGNFRTVSTTPMLDRGIGAANAGLELPRIAVDLGRAAFINNDTTQFRHNSENVFTSSMLFSSVATKLDSGRSPGWISAELAPSLLVRTNPITGLGMAGVDILEGEMSGDYERAGGGYFVIGTFAVGATAKGILQGRSDANRLSNLPVDDISILKSIRRYSERLVMSGATTADPILLQRVRAIQRALANGNRTLAGTHFHELNFALVRAAQAKGFLSSLNVDVRIQTPGGILSVRRPDYRFTDTGGIYDIKPFRNSLNAFDRTPQFRDIEGETGRMPVPLYYKVE